MESKKQEIKKLVRDAEAHADEDRKRRDTIEARNQLDSLVYQTEKSLQDHGASVDPAERARVEEAVALAKKTLDSQDAETIREATNELSKASHKLAEAMYAKAASTGGASAEAGSSGGEPGGGAKKDDVVDADFEEVKEG